MLRRCVGCGLPARMGCGGCRRPLCGEVCREVMWWADPCRCASGAAEAVASAGVKKQRRTDAVDDAGAPAAIDDDGGGGRSAIDKLQDEMYLEVLMALVPRALDRASEMTTPDNIREQLAAALDAVRAVTRMAMTSRRGDRIAGGDRELWTALYEVMPFAGRNPRPSNDGFPQREWGVRWRTATLASLRRAMHLVSNFDWYDVEYQEYSSLVTEKMLFFNADFDIAILPQIAETTQIRYVTIDLWGYNLDEQLPLELRLSAVPDEVAAIENLVSFRVNAPVIPFGERLERDREFGIPSGLFELVTLKALAISSVRLDFARIRVDRLVDLEEFRLVDTGIAEMPTGFGALGGKLRVLDLGKNEITSIDAGVYQLAALKSLRLSGNAITELSPAISNLQKLRVLYLGDNALERLPEELGLLRELTSLFVAKNKLSAIPDSVGSLPALQTLDVSDNEGIVTLPDTFAGRAYRRTFILSRTSIRQVPSFFYELVTIGGVINLDGSALECFPAGLDAPVTRWKISEDLPDMVSERITRAELAGQMDPLDSMDENLRVSIIGTPIGWRLESAYRADPGAAENIAYVGRVFSPAMAAIARGSAC